MNCPTKETVMLSNFHERQLKTLEQGVNDIRICCRRNRLYVLFLYEDETIYGKITFMNENYLMIKNKYYYYDKIDNIYNYFTLQSLSLRLLTEWYYMEDDEEKI